MTCIHLLSLCPTDKRCGFVLACCGFAPFAYAVLFLLQSTPNPCFTPSVTPPPTLPPIFSLSAHHLHSPFNPIFTDLEISFHQLWMLKETNLLPSPGPSAAGPGRQSGCKNDSSRLVVFHNFTGWQYTCTALCIKQKPPKAQHDMLPTDRNLPQWILGGIP